MSSVHLSLVIGSERSKPAGHEIVPSGQKPCHLICCPDSTLAWPAGRFSQRQGSWASLMLLAFCYGGFGCPAKPSHEPWLAIFAGPSKPVLTFDSPSPADWNNGRPFRSGGITRALRCQFAVFCGALPLLRRFDSLFVELQFSGAVDGRHNLEIL